MVARSAVNAAAMEDGAVNVARSLADQLAGRDFDRAASHWFSNSFKLSDYRCRHCRLPHVVGYAGAGEGFSFLAALTNPFMGGEYV